MHTRAGVHRLVRIVFQRDVFATANPLIGGDQHLAIRIQNPVFQCIRGEATKHHRVDGAQTGTGEHGVGGLGNHRHINAHSIAFLDAALTQQIAQPADFGVQFPVSDHLVFRGVIPLPDDGDLIRPLLQMAIDAVYADIELAALEPGDFPFAQIALTHLVPLFVPGQKGVGLLRPEPIRVLY